jgi:hypothetical protein
LEVCFCTFSLVFYWAKIACVFSRNRYTCNYCEMIHFLYFEQGLHFLHYQLFICLSHNVCVVAYICLWMVLLITSLPCLLMALSLVFFSNGVFRKKGNPVGIFIQVLHTQTDRVVPYLPICWAIWGMGKNTAVSWYCIISQFWQNIQGVWEVLFYHATFEHIFFPCEKLLPNYHDSLQLLWNACLITRSRGLP